MFRFLKRLIRQAAGVIEYTEGITLVSLPDYHTILKYYQVPYCFIDTWTPGQVKIVLLKSQYNWYNFVRKANLMNCKRTIDAGKCLGIWVEFVKL